MTTPRKRPNIYSLKNEDGHDLRAVKINSSHIIHAGQPSCVSIVAGIGFVLTSWQMALLDSCSRSSPQWLLKRRQHGRRKANTERVFSRMSSGDPGLK